ncbi:serine-pyruvate aminotransferase/archaeal aspartate aminotransferase [Desulfocurvibacter africanus PCS]|uniref:Serine-pyruvate aminotransferase/archaeal aspartate aminotransferase n=2 Tax=Desulfocurvibacter africanus TaxID=873 RepID=M5Q1A0_DESAF|nr:serine-pyruvate aminotransferase/archaeal aspartate aminotransferase [Desulfocurvibacter africanus PCS]
MNPMLNRLRLLTPGPTPMPEEVRLAMARDMIHHRKPAFKEIMARVQKGLRTLFGTEQPVLSLSCSGSGAMAAAVSNLFSPGERVIVAEAGKFGERWVEIAEHRGLQVTRMSFEWGTAVDPARVAEELAAGKAKGGYAGLLVQVSETSTGVLHPLRELAKLTRDTDTLLLADGISAVGVSPCPLDEWGMDCLVTGSQKGLMLPPGLAFAALSEKAWRKAENVTPGCYYFDLKEERAACDKQQTRFTSAVGLMVGLDVALELLLTPGLAALYRKQWALTRMARAGIAAMGLPLYAAEHYTWGLTALAMPKGVDSSKVLAAAAKEHNVIMAGGQGHMKNYMVRVGHMGYVDFGDLAAGLFALASALQAQGVRMAAPDYLEQALAAYTQGLTEEPPLL